MYAVFKIVLNTCTYEKRSCKWSKEDTIYKKWSEPCNVTQMWPFFDLCSCWRFMWKKSLYITLLKRTKILCGDHYDQKKGRLSNSKFLFHFTFDTEGCDGALSEECSAPDTRWQWASQSAVKLISHKVRKNLLRCLNSYYLCENFLMGRSLRLKQIT